MTGPAAVSGSTAQERREARIERWQVGALDEIERLRNSLQDLGDRLAEKDAEIERLRTAVLNGCERPCVIESEITQIARADERRRTVEEIARVIEAHAERTSPEEDPIASLRWAVIRAREIGGSDA